VLFIESLQWLPSIQKPLSSSLILTRQNSAPFLAKLLCHPHHWKTESILWRRIWRTSEKAFNNSYAFRSMALLVKEESLLRWLFSNPFHPRSFRVHLLRAQRGRTETQSYPVRRLRPPEVRFHIPPVEQGLVPPLATLPAPRGLDLPDYEGGNPDDWLFRVEQCFTLHNIAEEAKLEKVISCLTGASVTWWRCSKDREKIYT